MSDSRQSRQNLVSPVRDAAPPRTGLEGVTLVRSSIPTGVTTPQVKKKRKTAREYPRREEASVDNPLEDDGTDSHTRAQDENDNRRLATAPKYRKEKHTSAAAVADRTSADELAWAPTGYAERAPRRRRRR
ncbi:unnamed protein product [Ixodes pacificus]